MGLFENLGTRKPIVASPLSAFKLPQIEASFIFEHNIYIEVQPMNVANKPPLGDEMLMSTNGFTTSHYIMIGIPQTESTDFSRMIMDDIDSRLFVPPNFIISRF